MIALTFVLQLGALLSDQDRQLIDLARATVEAEVLGKQPPPLKGRLDSRAVFVTIEVNGQVRGCRGSLTPITAHLEGDVSHFARAAAAHDPRYKPLNSKDLKSFLVTVTVVESIQPISAVDVLAPTDGLVLASGSKKGIVLPFEGRDPRTRLRWAYQKAGVSEGAPAQLYLLHARRTRG